MIFCDWTTLFVQLEHTKIDGGCIVATGPGDEHQYTVEKNVTMLGSWESRIQVKSVFNRGFYNASGLSSHLMIHGNLLKYMQGHTIFGTPDFSSFIIPAIFSILKDLNLKPTPLEALRIKNGQFEITRIDLTTMSRLNNNNDVELFLRKFASHAGYRGKPVQTVGGDLHGWGTNYILKNSKKWTFKNYNKFNELTTGPSGHRIPDYISGRKKLIEYSEGMVRHELTLRKPELRKYEIMTLQDLEMPKINTQYNNHKGKIKMADNIKMQTTEIINLPPHLQRTYMLWEKGGNVRSGFKTKQSYYQHRRELLKHGIDINSTFHNPDDKSNVIPLIRVLELKPESIPDFAYEEGLVYVG